MKTPHYRTWIEISKSNIKHNYHTFRRLLKPSVKVMGVVKSNAYGHELAGFAGELTTLGVDWLGVDSITEALTVRKNNSKTPLLVLGYILPENFGLAALNDISVTISSFENLTALKRLKKTISVHIKVDSGMHRQGFAVADLPAVITQLQRLDHVTCEGLFTHFAAAKDPNDTTDTHAQITLFKKAVTLFNQAGLHPLIHAAATGGAINFPESHFDMVRVGIGMYGLWPSPETKKAFQKKIILKPVLTWKSLISEVKWVEKNERIGYDYTEGLTKRSLLAVVPVGYWHGYWRAFSSKASVLVNGQRSKVIGRVSMDMIVIDVTNIKNTKIGDEVVLLGSQGKNAVTADDLGTVAGTSCYEIVTRINPLIKKNFV